MRLLLDEHYSQAIAIQLRQRGHDALAVVERSELLESSDAELLSIAAAERRAVVTENARHFIPLIRERVRAGDEHYGLVLVSARSFPRRRDRIGGLVLALDALLRTNPADDALVDQTRWLTTR